MSVSIATLEERTNALSAQVTALNMAVITLYDHLPDQQRNQFIKYFDRLNEALMAQLLNEQRTDAYIDQVQHYTGLIRKGLTMKDTIRKQT